MKQLCAYGCGLEAKYTLRNGKACCSKSFNSCTEIIKLRTASQNRPEVKEKKSTSMTILHAYDSEFRKNYKNSLPGRFATQRTQEYRQKCSVMFKKLHKDPEFKKNYINGLIKTSQNYMMNNEEQQIFNLLNILYPNVFIYNYRNKFTVTYNGNGNMAYKPDFYNENLKLVIDSFGTYWHRRTIKEQDITEEEYVNTRVENFKKAGYKCMCIWTKEEILNPTKLINRIQKFMEV